MPKDKIVDEEGKKKDPITYTLLEDVVSLSDSENIKKRVTIGKWGSNKTKVDIRTWKRDKQSGQWFPTKGITLTYEELSQLKEVIDDTCDKIAEYEEKEEDKKGKKKKKGD